METSFLGALFFAVLVTILTHRRRALSQCKCVLCCWVMSLICRLQMHDDDDDDNDDDDDDDEDNNTVELKRANTAHE